jgi:tripartite-type tricarboxylate transporter receptor subunit TctC
MGKGFQSKRCVLSITSFIFTFFIMHVCVSMTLAADKSYPTRPVNMIIPFAPGGGTDLGGKIVAVKIAEFLGQPLISNNKPGGGGSLAYSFVSKAKPDGYTITVVSSSSFCIPTEVQKVDYKFEDFILTGIWGRAPVLTIVRADSRWKTIKEFVEEAKKFPGKLSIGTAGPTSTGAFVARLLHRNTGIELTNVPFKSSGEALIGLMGGHVDAYIAGGGEGVQDNPKLRGLAVAEPKRLEGLTDIPTYREFGYPVEYSGRYGYMFPKGTPEEAVQKFANAQKMAVEKYSKEISEAMMKVDIWPIFLDRREAQNEFKKQFDVLRTIYVDAGPKK